jgi:hypothetical protein
MFPTSPPAVAHHSPVGSGQEKFNLMLPARRPPTMVRPFTPTTPRQ